MSRSAYRTRAGASWRSSSPPGAHFESFNPQELGFTPTWDFNKSLVVVRHDQEWFLRTFYPALIARPDTFSTPERLLRLGTVLRSSSRYQGWTHAAGKVLRAALLPEVTRRLAEAQLRLRGSEELRSAFESAMDQLTWLHVVEGRGAQRLQHLLLRGRNRGLRRRRGLPNVEEGPELPPRTSSPPPHPSEPPEAAPRHPAPRTPST